MALLLAKTKSHPNQINYLKPISTGPLSDNDGNHLSYYAGRLGLADRIDARTLVQLDLPLSPHLAQKRSQVKGGRLTTDRELLGRLNNVLARLTGSGPTLIEQAGGVHSPVLSGTSQADFYRPLRFPTVLIADKKLGGISNTISSYESLRVRGYTIDGIGIFKEDHYDNWQYLRDWAEEENKKVDVNLAFCALEPPPERNVDKDDQIEMVKYYGALLDDPALSRFLSSLETVQQNRLARLESMPQKTLDTIWYPFTQHKLLTPKDVTVIDSAFGDTLSTFDKDRLRPTFDGPASWWTQGLGHGNPDLAMTAAHAACRYGHVILPNATNEPVLGLTERLLASPVAKSWADRVFYSDNGSTAMEVAIKMAIRSSCERHGWRRHSDVVKDSQEESSPEVGIIGLQGAYHGDTIGAMDASEANVYNQAVDWYRGRGAWFDPPQVMVRNGQAEILLSGQWIPKGSLNHLYNVSDRLENDPMTKFYQERIEQTLNQLEEGGQHFGALILEPVVMGAGGMIFVDPLFQRVLVDLIRSRVPKNSLSGTRGIPVIFDEVFTGLYRLGRARAASFLGEETYPDVSTYAKLLTGGLAPLGVTLTSRAIFETFYKDTKAQALLHGHSYTGYPIGCAVASQALDTLSRLDREGAWKEYQKEWQVGKDLTGPTLWSVFSPEFTARCSSHPKVQGVMTLGSIFVIYLKPKVVDDSGGYSSTVSSEVVDRLRKGTDETIGMMMRPLGNVIYVMTGQRTGKEMVGELEKALMSALSA